MSEGFLKFRDPGIRRVQPPSGGGADPEAGDLWLAQAGDAVSSPLLVGALVALAALVLATVVVRNQVARRRHEPGEGAKRRREALSRDLGAMRRAREKDTRTLRRWEDAG